MLNIIDTCLIKNNNHQALMTMKWHCLTCRTSVDRWTMGSHYDHDMLPYPKDWRPMNRIEENNFHWPIMILAALVCVAVLELIYIYK